MYYYNNFIIKHKIIVYYLYIYYKKNFSKENTPLDINTNCFINIIISIHIYMHCIIMFLNNIPISLYVFVGKGGKIL